MSEKQYRDLDVGEVIIKGDHRRREYGWHVAEEDCWGMICIHRGTFRRPITSPLHTTGESCPNCQGSGVIQIAHDRHVCINCNGSGIVCSTITSSPEGEKEIVVRCSERCGRTEEYTNPTVYGWIYNGPGEENPEYRWTCPECSKSSPTTEPVVTDPHREAANELGRWLYNFWDQDISEEHKEEAAMILAKHFPEPVSAGRTPSTDYAFDGDPDVGTPPSITTWAQAKEYAKWLERQLIKCKKTRADQIERAAEEISDQAEQVVERLTQGSDGRVEINAEGIKLIATIITRHMKGEGA